jgi:hypothetical protein
MPRIWGLIDYPLTKLSEFQPLIVEFIDRKKRNVASPLKTEDTLIVIGPTSHIFLPEEFYPCSGTLDTHPSQSHPIKRQRAAESSMFPLVLSEPLRVGLGTLSQVWKAKTRDGASFVVKIFTSFMSSKPGWQWSDDPKDKEGGEVIDFMPDEEAAHREAWAYERLRVLQGSYIPHSYGFYQVSIAYFSTARPQSQY